MNGIVLLTDFGLGDGAVAAMKGVVRGVCRDIPFIDDLSHGVGAGDIAEGAFLLGVNYSFYPPGTIFVAVVDPGVGTDRKAVLVQTERYTFVGPDNGILVDAVVREVGAGSNVLAIVELTEEKFFRHPVSTTFHGRDIFAPVAAHVARGEDVRNFGQDLGLFIDLVGEPLEAEYLSEGGCLRGKVVFIDDFGNCVVSIRAQEFYQIFSLNEARILLKNSEVRLVDTFDDGEEEELVAMFGGDFPPFMTLAVNNGDAAESHGIKKGDTVLVEEG